MPHGLLSLWDMINFSLSSFVIHYRALEWYEITTNSDVNGYNVYRDTHKVGLFISGIPKTDAVPEHKVIEIKQLLALLGNDCNFLELDATRNRIDRFQQNLRPTITHNKMLGELRVLRETMEDEIKERHFYYYPTLKAPVLINVEDDWVNVFQAFPSTKLDAISAVDCFAFGQDTACVFHLMRVAEYGLRALARERRVKLPKKQMLEWADWYTIIESIRVSVKELANTKRGPKRDAALEFYQGALGKL